MNCSILVMTRVTWGKKNDIMQGRRAFMGIYINPENESMQRAVNSEIYADKTGLLGIPNKT